MRKPLVEQHAADDVGCGPLEVLLRVDALPGLARVEGASEFAPLLRQDAVQTRLVEAVRAQCLHEELAVGLVRLAVRLGEDVCNHGIYKIAKMSREI